MLSLPFARVSERHCDHDDGVVKSNDFFTEASGNMGTKILDVFATVAIAAIMGIVIHHPRLEETGLDKMMDFAIPKGTRTTAGDPARAFVFLRIAKTGSTALHHFLNQQKPDLHNLFDVLGGHSFPTARCMFVKTNSSYPPTPATKRKPTGCVHYYYEDFTELYEAQTTRRQPWARGTNHTNKQEGPTAAQVSDFQQYYNSSTNLQWISMIRHPFDRLVSLFTYSKWDWIDHKFTEKQEQYLEQNDIASWMESLVQEEHRYIAFQYMRFNYTDSTNAMTLIEGRHPRILTLLNECFEASLRLLLENMGLTGFNYTPESMRVVIDRVNSFSQGRHAQANKGKENTFPVELLQTLREKSKLWFAEDYHFYAHAVQQFQKMMDDSVAKSHGDTSFYDSCQYYQQKDIQII